MQRQGAADGVLDDSKPGAVRGRVALRARDREGGVRAQGKADIEGGKTVTVVDFPGHASLWGCV